MGLPSAHAVETQLPFDIHSEAITPGEAGQLVHELDSLPEPHTLLMVQTALGALNAKKPLVVTKCGTPKERRCTWGRPPSMSS